MRLPRLRFTVRRMAVVVAVIVFLALAYLAILSYGVRSMLRHEASYNAEMWQRHHDFEARLRAEIDRLQKRAGTSDEQGTADRVFEMLKLSRVANNSREVGSWEGAPHSPERTLVALKWARVAADEAAYEAALCERWAVDYARGRMPHHIGADEVPPFRMPAGWKDDDLKYGRAEHDR